MNMPQYLLRKLLLQLSDVVTNYVSGTQRHRVKIFNINNGQAVSHFEPYAGFLRDRSAAIAATAFHPHRLLIAAAAMHDNHVNLFACHEPKHAAVKTVKLWDGGSSTVASSRASVYNG